MYDDLVLTAECFISDPAQIPVIAGWLKGGGTVTFANRTGGHYNARIANQIPFETVLRGNPYRTFSVNFRCFPFWYADDVREIEITQSGSIVNNPGSVYSEPVMNVIGSGNVTLMVGSTLTELTGLGAGIIIDSVLKEAYADFDLRNNHMSGDFPVLKPGANAISWVGDVSKIVIQPNWRYL